MLDDHTTWAEIQGCNLNNIVFLVEGQMNTACTHH